MKPGEHPEFFRFPAPEGRSRESTIVLRADGHFEHDGAPVEHMRLEQAMHTWVSRHPDDGRFILTNGYDWTYFKVEDAPFFVRHLRPEEAPAEAPAATRGKPSVPSDPSEPTPITMVLSDGSEEPLVPAEIREGTDGALYAFVKHNAKGGPFEAKFTRHAQTSLARFLRPDAADSNAMALPVADAADAARPAHWQQFLPKPRDISPKK